MTLILAHIPFMQYALLKLIIYRMMLTLLPHPYIENKIEIKREKDPNNKIRVLRTARKPREITIHIS